jgi:probable HAF family extracellular repeat protein
VGKVVGYSYLSGDNTYHAILHDGSLHDLGTFNGGGYSYAYAINASGQVVGYSDGFGSVIRADHCRKSSIYCG